MPKLPPHQWIVSPVTYSGKQATESVEKKIDMKHPNDTLQSEWYGTIYDHEILWSK